MLKYNKNKIYLLFNYLINASELPDYDQISLTCLLTHEQAEDWLSRGAVSSGPVRSPKLISLSRPDSA